MPAPKDIVDSVSEFARQVYTGTVPPLSPKAKWGIVTAVLLSPLLLIQCARMEHAQEMRQWCHSIDWSMRPSFPECDEYVPNANFQRRSR